MPSLASLKKPVIISLSNLRRRIPGSFFSKTGIILGGVTLGATTLMSGYADTRERLAKSDIDVLAVEIEKERQNVKNDMYRNVVQREEFQRDPTLYNLERIGSIGKTPGGQQSYTGLITIVVIAIAGIYLVSGLMKK